MTLKELRKNAHLTLAQVGEALNITGQAVTHYENGRTWPSVETSMILAKLYSTDLDGIIEAVRETKGEK